MSLSASRRAFCGSVTRGIGTAVAIACVVSLPNVLADEQSSSDPHDQKKDPDGDNVYEPGGDVKPPKLLHYVEPEFSPKSKEAFVEGTVKISTIVTADGVATAFHVISGLNAEEDRTAVEALKQWKFQPGTKRGQPVKVRVTVEIAFHLL